MLLIIFLYAIFAMTNTIGKLLLDFVPPIFLISLRMTLAGCVILTTQYLFYGLKKIDRKDFYLFFLMIFIHILIPYVSEFVALQSVAPSCAALVFNLSPYFTALFSYIFFKEYMTLKKWVGFIIGFIGIYYLIVTQEMGIICLGINIPYLLLLIAVFTSSLGWIFLRILMEKDYSPLQINGVAMIGAGIVGFPISKILEGSVTIPWGQMQSFLSLLIAIILLGNIIFYNFYGFLLKKYTATLLSFVGFITPLFTALYDWLWLGISVNMSFFIASAIVGLGIYIFYQEELKQGYVENTGIEL